MPRIRIPSATFLSLSIAFALLALSAPAQITYETRALTGTDGPLGPGLGPGVSFNSFESQDILINALGQVAFRGHLDGLGVTSENNFGLWSEGGGSGLAMVARKGDPAPGTTNGEVFVQFLFGTTVLNDAGQTSFVANLASSGGGILIGNSQGIWSEKVGSGLSLMARAGSPAPGEPTGWTFDTFAFQRVASNRAGQSVFWGETVGPGFPSTPDYGSGIWSDRGGTGLTAVVREGDVAPGIPVASGVPIQFSEAKFSRFGESPVFNSAGQIAFSAFVSGIEVNASNDEGIWSEGGGSGLKLLAREGGQAQGAEAGVNFGSFVNIFPQINNAGQIAFRGTLTGTGVTSANDQGIWSEGGGSGLALVARKGDQAPGTAAGVNFNSISDPRLNGAGQTAFYGSLTGEGVTSENDEGIWSESGGSGLALVAREGDQAPGTEDGVNFRYFRSLSLNGAGQIAFMANLIGEGVTSVNDRGIWATDLDGQLQLIIRKGDLFNISNDPSSPQWRTVSGMFDRFIQSSESGYGSIFNDAGQLAFIANFGSSSGVFVANTVPAIQPADLDGDGDVDDADFGIMFAAFTGPNNGPSSNLAADLDYDDDVDDVDFGIAFAAFTGPGGPPANVPEPTSLALLSMAGLTLVRRRSRHS